MFFKISVLKNLAIFTKKSTCVRVFCGTNQWTGFYMITPSVMKELKEIPTQAFCYEYRKIFKNSFFYRAALVAVPECCHWSYQPNHNKSKIEEKVKKEFHNCSVVTKPKLKVLKFNH